VITTQKLILRIRQRRRRMRQIQGDTGVCHRWAIGTGEYRSLFAELRCTRFVAHLSTTSTSHSMPGFADNRGGNSVDVRINGRKETLHSLWDTALVELEQGTPAEIAARIQATVTGEDRQQWQQGTPAEWALESLAIVRTQVYRLPASGEVTASYVKSARAVIRTCLAQAGARLAWMLNETLITVPLPLRLRPTAVTLANQ
jgi:hypothetical protein